MILFSLRWQAASVFTLLLVTPLCRADLVETFTMLDGGTLTNPYEFHRTNLEVDGVTFDAVLTVTSSGPLFKSTNSSFPGLGVNGSGYGYINSGEWLRFTLEVLNPQGGPAPTAKLSSINYTPGPFTSLPEIHLSPADNLVPAEAFQVTTTGTEIDVVALPEWAALEVYSIAGTNPSAGLTAHYVYGITATFSSAIAAVPEPSGFLFGGLVSTACGVVGRRSKRRAA